MTRFLREAPAKAASIEGKHAERRRVGRREGRPPRMIRAFRWEKEGAPGAPYGAEGLGDQISRAGLVPSERTETTHPATVRGSSSEMYPPCSETAGESARGECDSALYSWALAGHPTG